MKKMSKKPISSLNKQTTAYQWAYTIDWYTFVMIKNTNIKSFNLCMCYGTCTTMKEKWWDEMMRKPTLKRMHQHSLRSNGGIVPRKPRLLVVSSAYNQAETAHHPWPGWNGPWPGWSSPSPGWNSPLPGWSSPRPGWSSPRPGWTSQWPGWTS